MAAFTSDNERKAFEVKISTSAKTPSLIQPSLPVITPASSLGASVNTVRKPLSIPNKQWPKDLRQILVAHQLGVEATFSQGDCFFDSVARGLTAAGIFMPGDDKSVPWNVKKVRGICHSYLHNVVKPDPSHWVIAAMNDNAHGQHQDGAGDDYVTCLNIIQYTADEMAEKSQLPGGFHGAKATWGRPYIEGRLLCEILDIQLHYIELGVKKDDDYHLYLRPKDAPIDLTTIDNNALLVIGKGAIRTLYLVQDKVIVKKIKDLDITTLGFSSEEQALLRLPISGKIESTSDNCVALSRIIDRLVEDDEIQWIKIPQPKKKIEKQVECYAERTVYSRDGVVSGGLAAMKWDDRRLIHIAGGRAHFVAIVRRENDVAAEWELLDTESAVPLQPPPSVSDALSSSATTSDDKLIQNQARPSAIAPSKKAEVKKASLLSFFASAIVRNKKNNQALKTEDKISFFSLKKDEKLEIYKFLSNRELARMRFVEASNRNQSRDVQEELKKRTKKISGIKPEEKENIWTIYGVLQTFRICRRSMSFEEIHHIVSEGHLDANLLELARHFPEYASLIMETPFLRSRLPPSECGSILPERSWLNKIAGFFLTSLVSSIFTAIYCASVLFLFEVMFAMYLCMLPLSCTAICEPEGSEHRQLCGFALLRFFIIPPCLIILPLYCLFVGCYLGYKYGITDSYYFIKKLIGKAKCILSDDLDSNLFKIPRYPLPLTVADIAMDSVRFKKRNKIKKYVQKASLPTPKIEVNKKAEYFSVEAKNVDVEMQYMEEKERKIKKRDNSSRLNFNEDLSSPLLSESHEATLATSPDIKRN